MEQCLTDGNMKLKDKIKQLTQTMQALSLERFNAMQADNKTKANALRLIEIHINNKIAELEGLASR
jgi:hypothetical protein